MDTPAPQMTCVVSACVVVKTERADGDRRTLDDHVTSALSCIRADVESSQ